MGMEVNTKEAVVELLVGSYITRTTGRKLRVVRVKDTHTFRAYLDGALAVEGTRRECIALASG